MATITLPVINNPSAPAVGTFNKYWVTQMTLTATVFTATLSAYDGTNLLTGHDKRITVPNLSAPANSALNTLVATSRSVIQTVASKTTLPDVIVVNAPLPTQAVRAVGIWNPAVKTTPPTQPTVYQIADLLALAGTNADIANAVGALLTWVSANVPA